MNAVTSQRRLAAAQRVKQPIDVPEHDILPGQPAILRRTGISLASSIQTITPQFARWLRDNCHFERQRKITQFNIDRLSAEMSACRFTPGTQVYLCRLPDGRLVIVNANHTLEAIVQCGIPQDMTLTIKDVADLEEAGRIYAVFDVHKARTWLDSLRAIGSMADSPTSTTKVLAAIGVIEARFFQASDANKIAQQSRLGRIDRMTEYTEVGNMFFQAIDGSQTECRKFAVRAPILAVALETFRYQPAAAAEFWRAFALDNGLTEGMPQRALLTYLRGPSSSGDGKNSRKLQCRAAALAWNAFFEEREIKTVKPLQMTKFYLRGTPAANGLTY